MRLSSLTYLFIDGAFGRLCAQSLGRCPRLQVSNGRGGLFATLLQQGDGLWLEWGRAHKCSRQYGELDICVSGESTQSQRLPTPSITSQGRQTD